MQAYHVGIGDHGARVSTHLPIVERFMRFVMPEPNSGCWLWIGCIRPNGYGQFWEDGAHEYAHRASYKIHIGPIPPSLGVFHKCDNRQCANPSHLFVGTPKENIQDMWRKGRQGPLPPKRGEANASAKLTRAQVAEIRRSTEPGTALGRRFGVSKTAISRVRLGRTWREVRP